MDPAGAPLTEPLSTLMGALRLDAGSSRDPTDSPPAWTGLSEPAEHGSGSQSGSAPGPDLKKVEHFFLK